MEIQNRYDKKYIKIPEYNYQHLMKCLSKSNYTTDLWHGFLDYIDKDGSGVIAYEVMMDGYYVREDLYVD